MKNIIYDLREGLALMLLAFAATALPEPKNISDKAKKLALVVAIQSYAEE